MRFRDGFWSLFVLLSIVGMYLFTTSAARQYRMDSQDINQKNSNRVSTTLLRDNQWSEFYVASDATSIRVMTNGALRDTELPQESQTDPRSGWRYSIEYQLVDSGGNVLKESTYHLRSGVRELVDADTGEVIDPLVFGKTSMVATQTRFIQIPIATKGVRPRRVRIRAGEKDPEVVEVVARVRTRHERPHYKDRTTWKQISSRTRRNLARFCVFDHKFLTSSERASLLRWQWVKAPPIEAGTIRHLYFFGDVDDQEVAKETVPLGTCLQPGWRSTLALPQSQGELRLTVERTEQETTSPAYLTGNWFDSEGNPPEKFQHTVFEDQLVVNQKYEGGVLELESSEPIFFRSYWKNLDADSTVINDAGKPLQIGEEVELTKMAGEKALRVYLADQAGISFPISHFADQPTPFRLSARLGYGNAFLSDENLVKQNNEFQQPTGWGDMRKLRWEYLDNRGNQIDQGEMEIIPEISAYDRIWKNGIPHPISEKMAFYFSVPPAASAVRLVADEPFLVNASVRPRNVPWQIRVPEDQQPFERQSRRTRKWFGLKPNSHIDLIAGNRSFMLSAQSRIGIIDLDADAEEALDPDAFIWHRYEPRGDWIGRQILVPADDDSEIKRRAMFAWLFEATPNRQHVINEYDFKTNDDYRLTYVSTAKRPGNLRVWQNGRLVQEESLVSSRGQVKLDLRRIDDTSTLRFECESHTRLFFSGAKLDGAPRYLKRTACRLQDGELEFQYTKTSTEAETLTLSIYREQDAAERCKLEVKIVVPEESVRLNQTGPVEHLTILHRIYDLKAEQQRHAVLVGSDTPLDVEHKCFLQLGEDLPPGEYTIKTNRMDGNRRGFVLLHQLRPIVRDPREIQ